MSKLNPENHIEIYDEFDKFEAVKVIQNLGFFVMHTLYSSKVEFTNDSKEQINHHIRNRGSVILAPNHQSLADTPTIASLVYEDTFSPLKGTTIIPAKAEMFDWPLLGRFFPHMLAHPAFRAKNFSKDAEGTLLRKQVTEELISFNINHLNKGGHSAIFAESTRNKKSPRDVQELKSGIGRIALGVDNPNNLLIVPLGFAYKLNKLKLMPSVVVGDPITPVSLNQEQLLHKTRSNIQDATIKAFRNINK